ncbi:MAG: phospholipase D-like domain-containing protein [Parasphingorhabdus sp.]|uniref:phospholipase D-like domain-containing protein n=1 Tax=Parasphingorhabdus sp. TaxID=2709688 RepID=UPI0030017A75
MAGIFEPQRNCWTIAKANRAAVIIDAENYFRYVRRAMTKAKSRIVLLSWDFDARIKMHDTENEVEGPLEVGAFIESLVENNPELHIYILRWDTGAIKSLFRSTVIFTLIKWIFHPRIHLKLDSHHPVGAAHHHKVIAIDDDTAFCGGIDITDDRWDTRHHRKHEPGRKDPNNKDAGPWHDAAMAMQGPVASALAEFSEQQWNKAGGKKMVPIKGAADCWPDDLKPMFCDVDMAIARTQPKIEDQQAISEIEELYLDLIATAKKHFYAESQYFASRKIAAAIAKRLDEKNGPEFVIINPVTADGWLESKTMDTKRKRLIHSLRKRDNHGRLQIYHVENEAGQPIYIHAKIVIVDDRIIRIGSSNFNNRSLGFDTECDVAIDAEHCGSREHETEVRAEIRNIRHDLLAEHLGSTVAQIETLFERTGSLIETIQQASGSGQTLREYQTPDLNETEEWLGDHDLFDPADADDDFAIVDRRWK